MKRANRKIWTGRVAKWKRSGLTAAEFGAREGCNGKTLKFWKWKLGQRRAGRPRPPGGPGTRFIEVITPSSAGVVSSDPRFEIEVGPRKVRFDPTFDPAALSRLLDVLEGRR